MVLLIKKWMGLFLSKNHLLRSWGWLSLLNWIGALTLFSISKTASKKIGALICSMKFLSPEVALYLYKSTTHPCMEYCYHILADAPSCYLELGYFKKIQTGGFEDILFWKTHRNFSFFTLPLEFPDKTKLNPWIFHKIVLYPLEIPHYFFLVTLENSTSFLINTWKFHVLFLWYPWKFHILNPPPLPCHLDFFWNSPLLDKLEKGIYRTVGP